MSATSPTSDAAGAPSRKLVIVSGSGRSGTSTVAGTLKLLGLTVPQPEVKANDTNPRGFFEPRWVVDRHKEWLRRAGVATLDARPEAARIAAEFGARAEPRAVLDAWLAEHLSTPQVVVKDPRTFWLGQLWRDAAAAAGAEVAYLTMLRHPAEVIGSRDAHYLQNLSPADRLARETAHLAGWVNVVLVNERATRDRKRVFVEYPALLTDWRSTMRVVADRLELRYDADLTTPGHHPVDDFIDADLRRVRLTWADLRVPRDLQELAEEVWQGLLRLSVDPDDPAVREQLDAATAAYQQIHDHAVAISHHAQQAAVRRARTRARRKERAAQAAREAAHQTAAAGPAPLAQRVRGRAARLLRRGSAG